MRRDALQRRAIVAQNRLFSILSDVVRLVAVGGDTMQSYIVVLANFNMAPRRGALQQLASYCELGFSCRSESGQVLNLLWLVSLTGCQQL